MDNHQKRILLFVALVLPVYLFWLNNMEKQRQKTLKARQAAAAAARPDGAEPGGGTELLPGPDGEAVPAEEEATPRARLKPPPEEIRNVVVRTKSREIEFTSLGGVPVRWDVTDERYLNPKGQRPSEDDDGRVRLIDPVLAERDLDLPFQTILKEQQARFYNEFNYANYSVEETKEDGATVLRFVSPPADSGLRMVKTYRIPDEGFTAAARIELINEGGSKLIFNNEGLGLGVALGPGLGPPQPPVRGMAYGIQNYPRPFLRVPGKIVDLDPQKDGEARVRTSPEGGIDWAGIQNQYFLFSAIPGFPDGQKPGFIAAKTLPDQGASSLLPRETGRRRTNYLQYPRLELYGEPFSLAPGESVAYTFDLFGGPKDRKILRESGGLERVLFHTSWGWFRALCLMLMTMLDWFHAMLGNWGVAIVGLVIVLRIATFPLAYIGMKHTAKMTAEQKRLKPLTDKLKEKYKDDPRKFQQEQFKLWQEHGFNPLAGFKGCLWMMIQIPIFIALYRLLIADIPLRGAEFLWVEDLSREDALFALGFELPLLGWSKFNLLPLLTAITQFYSTKVSMAASPGAEDNPMQKQMLYMMPAMQLLFTYSLPAGLFLYWTCTNLWQLVQQQYVTKRVMAHYAEREAAAAAARASGGAHPKPKDRGDAREPAKRK